MIHYEWVREELIAVFKDNQRIGKIQKYIGSDGVGYQYFPRGGKGSIVFDTMQECKDEISNRHKEKH
jgi:hypothetical protein